jgi:branched-chain amino acid aminotransferase
MMPFAYFQGAIVPSAQAQVSIASNSLQYGTTCFAGIRGYVRDNAIKVFRLEDHHHRLMNGGKIMGMNSYMPFDQFKTVIEELVQANKPTTDFYIRPFLYTGSEVLAPKPKGLHFELAVYFVPLGNYFDPNKGMKLMVSSWRKFADSAMPTKAKAGGCYVNSFLATSEAMSSGYDEALVMDHEGYIVEASVANILMSYRGKLIIPETGSAQLEGITMRSAIELLREEGLSVCHERIDRSMLYTCDELVLLGTAAQVSFAESVDKRIIGCPANGPHLGPGPVCKLLRKKYAIIIEGDNNHKWISTYESC